MGSHLGIKLGTSRTEGRALLNRLSANPCSMLYSLQKRAYELLCYFDYNNCSCKEWTLQLPCSIPWCVCALQRSTGWKLLLRCTDCYILDMYRWLRVRSTTKKLVQSINLRPKSLYLIVWPSHFSSCVWSIFVPYLTKRIKFELGIAFCFLKFCNYELKCVSKTVVHLWFFNYSNLVMCFLWLLLLKQQQQTLKMS